MRLFTSATTYIVSVTLVQAAPIPMTEFLQSSARAIHKGFNSLLDSVCTACVLKSDIEETSHSPLLKKSILDTDLELARLNAIQSSSKSSTGRKKATINQVNEIWGVNVNNEASTPKSKSIKFSPHLTTHDSQSLLELKKNLRLARLNAKSTSRTPKLAIEKVNEMWKNELVSTREKRLADSSFINSDGLSVRRLDSQLEKQSDVADHQVAASLKPQISPVKAPRENELTETSVKSSLMNSDDLAVRQFNSDLKKHSEVADHQVAASLQPQRSPVKMPRENSITKSSVINSDNLPPRQTKSLIQIKLDTMKAKRLGRESHRIEVKQFFEAKAPRENELTETSVKSSLMNSDDLAVRQFNSDLKKHSEVADHQVAASLQPQRSPVKVPRENSLTQSSVINSDNLPPRQTKSLTLIKLDAMKAKRLGRESHRNEMKEFFASLDTGRRSMMPTEFIDTE